MMRSMADGSVDLVVTSPPYNAEKHRWAYLEQVSESWEVGPTPDKSQGYDQHDDAMAHAEYVEWQRSCLWEMLRLIPSTGAILYNQKWRPQSGQWQDRADIVEGFRRSPNHHLVLERGQ